MLLILVFFLSFLTCMFREDSWVRDAMSYFVIESIED